MRSEISSRKEPILLSSPSAARPSTLIVSAADKRFSGLLRSMLTTVEPVLAPGQIDFACFDIGLAQDDRSWLSRYAVSIRQPGGHFGIDPDQHSPALRSFLARPFLPDYFPGYGAYVWIDSDIWLQEPEVVFQYVDGAVKCGLAIAHEEERAYHFQPRLFGWTAKHFLLGYGPLAAAWLLASPHVNAGFFALTTGASQWAAWRHRYEAAIRRTGSLVPHDQFALNHALHATGRNCTGAALLGPTCNWICDRGAPMWHDEGGYYCVPYPPYTRIAALHLAGPGKTQPALVRRTGGGAFRTLVLHGTSPTNPVLTIEAAGRERLAA